jgi:hypothetical protein
MFNRFRKKTWMMRPASQIRSGDYVDGVFEGEVVYVDEKTTQDYTYLIIVVLMPKPLCNSKTASFTTSPDKKIKVLKK